MVCTGVVPAIDVQRELFEQFVEVTPPMFELKDLITIGLASVGAVLGVLNFWRAFDRDRPKLRVSFAHAIPVGGADPRIRYSIEVINLSTFPLTITEVGVLLVGTKKRGAVVHPVLIDGGDWPRRLEPRSAVSALLLSHAFDKETNDIRCAYAKTSCDSLFKGHSKALAQVAKEHKQAKRAHAQASKTGAE
jgi:hypothetical protein